MRTDGELGRSGSEGGASRVANQQVAAWIAKPGSADTVVPMTSLSTTQFPRRIDADTFEQAADSYGLDPELSSAAAVTYARGSSVTFGLSGKQGSGKDTIAVEVAACLQLTDPLHLSFAAPMKDEADLLLGIIRLADSPNAASKRIADDFNVSLGEAEEVVSIAWDEARSNPRLQSRDRCPVTRSLLQFWGTEVRRAQDVDYWVRLALRDALPDLVAGRPIYMTDVRFTNEAIAAQRFGFWVARLEVSQKVQQQRLLERDGKLPAPEAFTHSSETELDTYPSFDLVVDNDGPIGPTVDELVALLTGSSHS